MICKYCWWFRNPANHHLGCDRNLVNQWDKLPFPQLVSWSRILVAINSIWLVVSTHLKNMIVKLGSSSPNFRGENKKYLSCHHPGIFFSPWKQQEDFQQWLFLSPASSVAAFHVDQAPWSSSTCVCHQVDKLVGTLVGPNGGWTLKWWVYKTTMDFPTRNDQHLGWRFGGAIIWGNSQIWLHPWRITAGTWKY